MQSICYSEWTERDFNWYAHRGRCYTYTTAGSTAIETNHCLSSNRSKQWQCAKLFIDYLYLHFTSETYQSASTDARRADWGRDQGEEHQGPDHGGRAGVKGAPE